MSLFVGNVPQLNLENTNVPFMLTSKADKNSKCFLVADLEIHNEKMDFICQIIF